MLRIIFLQLIVILCINISYSQNLYSAQLLNLEKEYFYTEDSILANNLLVQKFDLHLKNNVCSMDVLNDAKRINFTLIKDSILRNRFLWNASLVSYFNKDNYYSKI